MLCYCSVAALLQICYFNVTSKFIASEQTHDLNLDMLSGTLGV